MFDDEIIDAINTTFGIMNQMGAGPPTTYYIVGDSDKWTDFTTNNDLLMLTKSYVKIKAKLLFDPPANPNLLQTLNANEQELSWRISVLVDPPRSV